jgi:hypothetical protein
MPDKKLNDSEIVKALEDLVKCNNNEIDCGSCALSKFYPRCPEEIGKFALDLINRLQAENERLQNILICFMDALGKVRKVDDIDEISLIPLMSELNKQYRAELKAEAYKEFVNRLESELGGLFLIKHKVVCDVIDNLLKELVGEDK